MIHFSLFIIILDFQKYSTLTGALCEDHKPENGFRSPYSFLLLFKTLIFTPFIEIKICLEKNLISKSQKVKKFINNI